MQIISETYDYMKRALHMDDDAMSQTFAEWNDGELNSFLVEITATVLKKKDPDTSQPLVEMILDTAGQKGTGKWTSQSAMDFGIPIPTIDSAVSMRQISSQKATRGTIASKLAGHHSQGMKHDWNVSVDDLRGALLCAFVITYAQGMSLLQEASKDKGYGLDLAAAARIWRGGCIIRSALLEEIRSAYANEAGLPSLLLDDKFIGILDAHGASLRKTVAAFVAGGIPAMCLSSVLAYFDAFRTERLPANLIQAQRDFFGAHTYQRLDREGTFHTSDWDA